MAAVAVAVFWLLGAQEKTSRTAATQFAAALVHNDPDAAPPGAGDYVTGVRTYFGPVTSARVIGAHNKAVGEDPHSRTFFVAELLLRTKRGPAVIELEFDNHALVSEKVSRVYELEPDDAPGLAARDRDQLAAAYAARGGQPADQIAFTRAGAQSQPTTGTPVVDSPAPANASPQLTSAEKRLRCVQRAAGDVAKLQECARS